MPTRNFPALSGSPSTLRRISLHQALDVWDLIAGGMHALFDDVRDMLNIKTADLVVELRQDRDDL